MKKDIVKRWNERVVPNNWDKTENGAEQYVSKYGKLISQEKLKMFRDYAQSIGCISFVNGINKFITDNCSNDYMRDLVGNERIKGVNGDAQCYYEDFKNDGDDVRLVETTIKHLSKINSKTSCGCEFNQLDQKFYNLKIRACYNKTSNEVSSFDIRLLNKDQGYEIEKWGTRFEDSGDDDGWWYFEDE